MVLIILRKKNKYCKQVIIDIKTKKSDKKSNKSKIYWGKNSCVSANPSYPTIFGQTLIKLGSFPVDFFILGV